MIHYSEEVKERILRKIQTEKAEGNQRQIWNQPLHNSELQGGLKICGRNWELAPGQE